MSTSYASNVLNNFYFYWAHLLNSNLASERRLALFAKTIGLVTHDRIVTGLPRGPRP